MNRKLLVGGESGGQLVTLFKEATEEGGIAWKGRHGVGG